MAFTSMSDSLQKRMGAQSPLRHQLETAQVLTCAMTVFQECFGSELSAHIKPLFLKNRTLTVTCSSSVLAQEIRMKQGDIVQKINNILGKKEVDRIRYLS